MLFSCTSNEEPIQNEIRKEALTSNELEGKYEGSYSGSGYSEYIKIEVDKNLEYSLQLLINGEVSDYPIHHGHLRPYIETIENKDPNGDVSDIKYNHFIEFIDNDGNSSIYRSNHIGTRLYPARSFYSSEIQLIKK